MTKVTMVFTILPHDPMICPRCRTMVTAYETACPTCYPKEGAK